MIKAYSYEGRILNIENQFGRTVHVEFKTDIHTCLQLRDCVLVNVGNNEVYRGRNIFCVSENGEFVWQVQHPNEFHHFDAKRSAAFTYLGVKDGKIIGGSLDDFNYEINFETGSLLNAVLAK